MKLLFCPKCADIIALRRELRTCHCGEASGRYIDNLNAEISGGVPLGIDNRSFLYAVATRPETGLGSRFDAFVIPIQCDSVAEVAELADARGLKPREQ